MTDPLTFIQVISLSSQNKRREHIKNHFDKHDINFNFFDAVTREDAVDVAKKKSLKIHEQSLSLGELGCFLSHVCLWEKMLTHGLPYLIIFEDDVVLSKSANLIINKIDKLLLNADIIKLETMKEKVLLSSIGQNISNIDFIKLESEHMGTAGYVITNQSAKYALTKLKNSVVDKPIDHFIFIDLLNELTVYQASPAIAIQEDVLLPESTQLVSELESERKARMQKPKVKLSFSAKLKREIKRLIKQFSLNNLKQKRRLKIKYKDYVVVPFEDEK